MSMTYLTHKYVTMTLGLLEYPCNFSKVLQLLGYQLYDMSCLHLREIAGIFQQTKGHSNIFVRKIGHGHWRSWIGVFLHPGKKQYLNDRSDSTARVLTLAYYLLFRPILERCFCQSTLTRSFHCIRQMPLTSIAAIASTSFHLICK